MKLPHFKPTGFGGKSGTELVRIDRFPAGQGILLLRQIACWCCFFAVTASSFADARSMIARHENMARFYNEQHKPPPTLIEIMTAADKGEPEAQKELADIYVAHQDFANGLKWYRKSAEQGHTNAQFCLAKILLRGHDANSLSPAVKADPDEAVLWLGRAANHNWADAQVELGECYQNGIGVNRDMVESYKWFALANKSTNATAKSALESLTLSLPRDEVSAGQQRADAFVPGKCASLPEPAYLSQLKLKGISGVGKRRLAIINNRTLAVQETSQIKLDAITISVRCLEIDEKSVLVQAGPFRKELHLND